MIRFSRKWRYRTNSLVLVLLVTALLVLVNYFLSDRFTRVDLTDGKEFTLAAASRKVVGGLDDLLSVSVYFSKKLPPNVLPLRSAMADLLDEYRAFSGGRMKVKFVDPARDEDTEKYVRSLGIQRIQMNVIEKDKAQVINGYLGIAVFFEDRREIIPVVASLRNLEYDLTAAIRKVQSKDVPTVGFLNTKASHQLFQDYTAVRRGLAKQYTVKPVNVDKARPVPDDVNLLVLPGASGLTPREKFAVDQFIMRGGRTLWLVDAVKQGQGLQATVARNVLEDLLRQYGVRVKKNLVLDRSNGMASFNSGIIRFSLPYAFWPKVTKANFSKDHPITNRLESLVLPWASPIEIVGEQANGVQVVELARTTPYGWTASSPFNLNPQQRFQVKPEDRKSRLLAVALKGKFTSFFKGKGVPPADPPKQGEAAPPDDGDVSVIEESPETSMLVLGDSDFISDSFLRAFPQNNLFFLNAIDWLAQGEELIGIRSRGATERPLEQISEAGKATTRWLATLVMPVLVVGIGLLRFTLRRRMRRVLADLRG